LTDTTQAGNSAGDSAALAFGKLKFISLNFDQVVVSMRKIRITNKTSMKGIRLMSGSVGELVLNLKMCLL
jgi:hypothetical protein